MAEQKRNCLWVPWILISFLFFTGLFPFHGKAMSSCGPLLQKAINPDDQKEENPSKGWSKYLSEHQSLVANLNPLKLRYRESLLYDLAQVKMARTLGIEDLILSPQFDPISILTASTDYDVGAYFRGQRLSPENLKEILTEGFNSETSINTDFDLSALGAFVFLPLRSTEREVYGEGSLFVVFQIDPQLPAERRNSDYYRAAKIPAEAILEVFVFNPKTLRFMALSQWKKLD